MSENNHPQDPDETSRNRGRHGDQDYRTFPNREGRDPASPEVPRTFPNSPSSSAGRGANGAAGRSSGPARVSPPVAPGESRPDAQPGSQSATRPGAQSASQSGHSSQDDRPGSEQPTQAQRPVDGSFGADGRPSQQQGRQPEHGPQSGRPQPPSPYQQNGQNPTQQPGQGRPQPSGQQPGQQPGHPQGGQYAGRQQGIQHGQQQSGQPGQPGQGRPGQPGQGGQPGCPQPGQPGQGGSQAYPGGPQPPSSGSQHPNGTQPPGGGQYPTGSQHSAYPAAYPAAGGHPAEAGTHPADIGSQPGAMGAYSGPGEPGGPDGFGPYGPQQPPRREKKGPGWGATIAIAAIAALLGGGLAFGGNYAMSALQGDEPRKVADQTIETPDWTQVAEKTSESVMSIQIGTNGQVQGLGSGALYDDQGHVITNNHVVAPADTPGGEIAVTMKNGETTEAEIVGRDPSTDIAIIELEQVPDGVEPLEVGDSKKLDVGDPVMALGNPLGLADSVTTGIVSALDRPVSTENIGEDASSSEKELTITNAIQTDAAINPGNSGGPLVDGNGRFIGVNSAAASLSQAGEGEQSGSIGIGFAIPSNQAVMIADQLIANGKAQHPFLGITLTDGHINSGGISRGSAKVQSVQGGTPADKAGLKDGDDIIEVAGTKVNNAIALRALVRAQPVNKPVEITLVRGGQEQKVDVTLVLQ